MQHPLHYQTITQKVYDNITKCDHTLYLILESGQISKMYFGTIPINLNFINQNITYGYFGTDSIPSDIKTGNVIDNSTFEINALNNKMVWIALNKNYSIDNISDSLGTLYTAILQSNQNYNLYILKRDYDLGTKFIIKIK